MDVHTPSVFWADTKEFFIRHSIALIFAVVVGALCVAPHFLASRALGNSYQGFPFIYQDDEDIYMARIQEIIDGHPAVGSPALFEYKNTWPPVIPMAEYIYAAPTLLFGIPLTITITVSKFILPALLFLLVYALLFIAASPLGRMRGIWIAIAAGLAVTLGYDFADYVSAYHVLTGSISNTHLLVWTRPVNPISGALILFSLLLILWRMIEGKIHTVVTLCGGVLLAISISYFFSWFISAGIVSLSFLYFLYQKNYRAAGHSALMMVGSILLQSPYWYHTLSGLGGAGGSSFALRNGAIFTHVPIINTVLLATTLIFGICLVLELYSKKTLRALDSWWWFCILLIGASWAAFTQQVITGMTIWPYHFVQYTIPLSIVVLCMVAVHSISPRFPKLVLALTLGAILGTLLFGIRAAQTYTYRLDDFEVRQSYMPLFAWINEHTQKDCVVLVDEEIDHMARFIPALTHCNVYSSTYSFFGIPSERILHNYLVRLRLRGITPKTVSTYLADHPDEVNTYFFTDYTQALSVTTTKETIQSNARIAEAYSSFYTKDFLKEVKTYRVDYILSPVSSTVGSVIPEIKTWSVVTRTPSWILYQVPSEL